MGYILRRMKNKKKNSFLIFSFWDMVDLKCKKSEKCNQKIFFVRFRWNFFGYDSNDFKNFYFLKSIKKNVKNKMFFYTIFDTIWTQFFFSQLQIFFSPKIVWFVPEKMFIEIRRKKKFWSYFSTIFEKIANL